MPKVGLQMELPDSFSILNGLAGDLLKPILTEKPELKLGKYSTTVEEDYVPYIIPQDYGNKTDVYWFSITDDSGTGLLITGDKTFNASAQKYTTDNLDRCPLSISIEGRKCGYPEPGSSGERGGRDCQLSPDPYQVFPTSMNLPLPSRPVSGLNIIFLLLLKRSYYEKTIIDFCSHSYLYLLQKVWRKFPFGTVSRFNWSVNRNMKIHL